jgi:hypothetical protein
LSVDFFEVVGCASMPDDAERKRAHAERQRASRAAIRFAAEGPPGANATIKAVARKRADAERKRASRAALQLSVDGPPDAEATIDAVARYEKEAKRFVVLRENRNKRSAAGDGAAAEALLLEVGRSATRNRERMGAERRRDTKNRKLYTRDEFLNLYDGEQQWLHAEIYLSKAALAAAKGYFTPRGRYRSPRPACFLTAATVPYFM